ncbi:three-Cys-motif partner protein TcmP [Edaphobacter sp. 12200R-103]|uniref:three-Cys-motif partner protein TcmP n=1 Tax=Edaphobacter sp. 12200R-103 TaxID=2703788 RepID=UPI00192E79EF|nr:three-Cys-motif partner protein TcmP [Edaphobacter sp. 12200R-103]
MLIRIFFALTKTFFDESSEQSKVKAILVRDYFWAWAKVILPTVQKNRNGKIAYIDLFAGPGRYKDGTKSTPLLVLESAIEDPNMRDRLVTFFNDASAENSGNLHREIAALPKVGTLKYTPYVMSEEVGAKIVDKLAKIRLVPTLFFVDPWGYKGLSLGLINSVLKNWGCDCVFFFNYNRINMGLHNEAVEDHMNVLFGKERADELRKRLAGMAPEAREAEIVETLAQALRGLGANFVLPFCFKDERGKRTSHHLVFATKHPRGYRIMKEIMAKQSSENHQGVASFGYCPASSVQTMLFELNRPLDDLQGMLSSTFSEQTLSVEQIYERHNVGTPYIMKNYKSVLLSMEEAGLITTNPSADKRRKGTIADHVRVTFPKR